MVRCADCGYLASRNIKSRQLEETELWTRNTGSIVVVVATGDPIYECPICLMQVDLRSEFGNNPWIHSPEQILPVIQRLRECDLSTRWRQGLTPKEFLEMIDREKMLEWQAKREEADREWREKQDRKLVIYAGCFTILGAVIGALIAIFH